MSGACLGMMDLHSSTGKPFCNHYSGLQILRTCWEVTCERERTDNGVLLVKAVDWNGEFKEVVMRYSAD